MPNTSEEARRFISLMEKAATEEIERQSRVSDGSRMAVIGGPDLVTPWLLECMTDAERARWADGDIRMTVDGDINVSNLVRAILRAAGP